jgi:hypothetical protein
MRDNVMDQSQGQPVRRATLGAWSMTAGLAWLLICSHTGVIRAQESLRWKLNAGEVLKYSTSQKTLLGVKIMGRERKQTRTQTTDYSWNVKEVAPSGEAQVIQRIDRVTMKVEAPPYMPFEFDSSAPKAEVPEPFELEVQQLKAAIGAEFSFTMKPTGEIAEITIPAATLKRLRDALPQEAVQEGAFSERGLKDLLMQSSPPPFPLTPLEPGKTWSSKPSRVTLPQLGTLVSEKTFTYQGPDAQNPRLQVIGMEGKMKLEPAAGIEVKIRTQEGKGSLSFDSKAGCLINSRSTQKMELSISTMGQMLDQTSEMTSTMTLVP